MDVLRAEAERLLEDLPFESVGNHHEAIHIKSSQTDYDNVTFEDKTLSDVELLAFIEDSPSHSDNASTKIVRMPYKQSLGIKSLASLFRDVWRSFHLDPYMIYMFHRNVPGFFQLPSTSPGNPLPNFYVNCQAYWLFWSYDPSTLSTKAILLSRTSPGGLAAYPNIHSQLKRYCGLASHPLYLALVPVLERITFVDAFLREQHKRVGRTEKHTGFSHFHIDRPQPHVENPEAELDNLSNLSRSASSVLVGLADMVQHLQCSETLAEAILNSNLTDATHAADLLARRETEIKNIATLVSPQLKQRFGYVSYIKERAQNQVTVIFNLLARGDAQANIDISKAVMRDSTSMKTVAVMTMVFLPATFYAALFAVPSLQWDQPAIIGNRFWIYWAVTIPTTVVVFFIWFGILRWEKIWERVSQTNRRTAEHWEREKAATKRFSAFA